MKPNLESSQEYLSWLENWLENLPPWTLSEPEHSAVLVVDMTNGFCNEGVLSSPRVNAIVPPIVHLLKTAWESGVREIYLLNDTHEPDAVEFGAFPPHCVRGSREAMPVEEIQALSFFTQIKKIEKNSLSSTIETGLLENFKAKPDLTHFVIVGNCTDLCVYQMAMALRLDANARQIHDRSVVVPVDCVATYDTPLEVARTIGAHPHPGDLIHAIFLQHMALNGVEVVDRVDFNS